MVGLNSERGITHHSVLYSHNSHTKKQQKQQKVIVRNYFYLQTSHLQDYTSLLITKESLPKPEVTSYHTEVTSYHLEVTFLARSHFSSLRSHLQSQKSLLIIYVEVTFRARSHFSSHRNHFSCISLIMKRKNTIKIVQGEVLLFTLLFIQVVLHFPAC